MSARRLVLAGLVAGVLSFGSPVAADDPAPSGFTVQGRLVQDGVALDGAYDVEFTLWDAETGGVQIGGPIECDQLSFDAGLFSVTLDFGAVTDDAPRWLEVVVDVDPGIGEDPVILTPRRPLGRAVQADFADVAALADVAITADNGPVLDESGNYLFDRGWVAVGVPVPLAPLDVGGDVRALGTVELAGIGRIDPDPGLTNHVDVLAGGGPTDLFVRFRTGGFPAPRGKAGVVFSSETASGTIADSHYFLAHQAEALSLRYSSEVSEMPAWPNSTEELLRLDQSGSLRLSGDITLTGPMSQTRTIRSLDALDLTSAGGQNLVLNRFDGGSIVLGRIPSNDEFVRARFPIVIETDAAKTIEASPDGAYSDGDIWMDRSSVAMKTDFMVLDRGRLFDRLRRLPVNEWRYRHDPDHVRHVGPTAEDFHAVFGLGDDPTSIASLDTAGVSLAAAKALIDRTDDHDDELDALRRENAELSERLARLEALVDAVTSSMEKD